MLKLQRILLAVTCAAALMSQAIGQAPSGKSAQDAGKEKSKDGNSSIVTGMMAFDKNKDGKLSKDEVTDVRLLRLFDRADANKDGVVTKEELMALAAQLDAESGQDGERGGRGPGGRGGRGFGGPGGPGGPGGRGPGGFGGPPQPGQILPPPLQEQLNLTAEQKKQVADLQKEVDTKLAKILTDAQKRQLREMRGRFGPPGGEGGRRGGP